jgi:hypothetical protein
MLPDRLYKTCPANFLLHPSPRHTLPSDDFTIYAKYLFRTSLEWHYLLSRSFSLRTWPEPKVSINRLWC